MPKRATCDISNPTSAPCQNQFKRGVEAMRRMLKGTSGDADRAFGQLSRGNQFKNEAFAAGVRTAWNRASPRGNTKTATTTAAKFGFKI
jgi:hypothetical protein